MFLLLASQIGRTGLEPILILDCCCYHFAPYRTSLDCQFSRNRPERRWEESNLRPQLGNCFQHRFAVYATSMTFVFNNSCYATTAPHLHMRVWAGIEPATPPLTLVCLMDCCTDHEHDPVFAFVLYHLSYHTRKQGGQDSNLRHTAP